MAVDERLLSKRAQMVLRGMRDPKPVDPSNVYEVYRKLDLFKQDEIKSGWLNLFKIKVGPKTLKELLDAGLIEMRGPSLNSACAGKRFRLRKEGVFSVIDSAERALPVQARKFLNLMRESRPDADYPSWDDRPAIERDGPWIQPIRVCNLGNVGLRELVYAGVVEMRGAYANLKRNWFRLRAPAGFFESTGEDLGDLWIE